MCLEMVRIVIVCTSRFTQESISIDVYSLLIQVNSGMMPVCYNYRQGGCHNTTCPYLHSNTSQSAPVCADFLKSICTKGNTCPFKHTYNCPEFEDTGTCSNRWVIPLDCSLSLWIKFRYSFISFFWIMFSPFLVPFAVFF
jgi:hypothetical protein